MWGDTVKWEAFEQGATLRTTGSEGGTILLDEAYEGARITIERDGHSAPFSITCGVVGWLVHTRFFFTETEARDACAEMQRALGEMVTAFNADLEEDAATDLCQRFVERFP